MVWPCVCSWRCSRGWKAAASSLPEPGPALPALSTNAPPHPSLPCQVPSQSPQVPVWTSRA